MIVYRCCILSEPPCISNYQISMISMILTTSSAINDVAHKKYYFNKWDIHVSFVCSYNLFAQPLLSFCLLIINHTHTHYGIKELRITLYFQVTFASHKSKQNSRSFCFLYKFSSVKKQSPFTNSLGWNLPARPRCLVRARRSSVLHVGVVDGAIRAPRSVGNPAVVAA